MSRLLTPLKDLQVLKHQIPVHGLTPNTSIQNKPLMIYKSAFAPSISASDIESHLRSVGVVEPQWRYTMFSTSHFHVCFFPLYFTHFIFIARQLALECKVLKPNTTPSISDNLPRTPRHLPRLRSTLLWTRGESRSCRDDGQKRRCCRRTGRRGASVDERFGWWV